jgi:hypothetical protein
MSIWTMSGMAVLVGRVARAVERSKSARAAMGVRVGRVARISTGWVGS